MKHCALLHNKHWCNDIAYEVGATAKLYLLLGLDGAFDFALNHNGVDLDSSVQLGFWTNNEGPV